MSYIHPPYAELNNFSTTHLIVLLTPLLNHMWPKDVKSGGTTMLTALDINTYIQKGYASVQAQYKNTAGLITGISN